MRSYPELNFGTKVHGRHPSAIRLVRGLISAALWFTCLLAEVPLQANQIQPLAIPELIHPAELIVRATVLSKSCQKDSEGRIYTRVELDAAEIWKGNRGPGRLTVVHGGGTLGEERVLVPGQVDYRIGDEAVLFLVFNSRGEAVTLAMSQGKFEIFQSAIDGEWLVKNPFHGTVPRKDKSGPQPETAPPLPLAKLRTLVQNLEK